MGILRDALRTRIRDAGDIGDEITNTEMNTVINASRAALFDLEVEIDEHWHRTTSNVSVTSGVGSLPSDFVLFLGLERPDTSYPSGYANIPRRPFQTRNDYSELSGTDEEISYEIAGGSLYVYPVSWSGTVRLVYVPTSGSYSDDITEWDAFETEIDWVVNDCVVRCKGKTEEDATFWAVYRDQAGARLRKMSSRDRGEAPVLTSIYRKSRFSPYTWRRMRNR